MSKVVEFELNKQGVRELMQSSEMQSILNEYAKRASEIAGEGFETDSLVGKNRANASIIAKTYQAKKKNSKENTLLKALNAVK